MNNRPLLILMFLISCFYVSCQKDKAVPCEKVLNDGPPEMVGILVVDEETGESIILAHDLDSTDVKVTSVNDGKPYKDYQIANAIDDRLMRGAVIFYAPKQEGVYLYELRVGDHGRVKFSYTVSRVGTGDACRPYVYPVSEVKIIDRPSEPIEHSMLPEQLTLLQVAL